MAGEIKGYVGDYFLLKMNTHSKEYVLAVVDKVAYPYLIMKLLKDTFTRQHFTTHSQRGTMTSLHAPPATNTFSFHTTHYLWPYVEKISQEEAEAWML